MRRFSLVRNIPPILCLLVIFPTAFAETPDCTTRTITCSDDINSLDTWRANLIASLNDGSVAIFDTCGNQTYNLDPELSYYPYDDEGIDGFFRDIWFELGGKSFDKALATPEDTLLAVFRSKTIDASSLLSWPARLLYGDSSTFELWNLKTGKLACSSNFLGEVGGAINLGEKERLFAFCAGSSSGLQLYVWDLVLQQFAFHRDLPDPPYVTVINDGQLYILSDGLLETYYLDHDRKLRAGNSHKLGVEYHWLNGVLNCITHDVSGERAICFTETVDSTIGAVDFVACSRLLDTAATIMSGSRVIIYRDMELDPVSKNIVMTSVSDSVRIYNLTGKLLSTGLRPGSGDRSGYLYFISPVYGGTWYGLFAEGREDKFRLVRNPF